MGSYFSLGQSKEVYIDIYSNADGYEINIIKMRDNADRLWNSITVDELKVLTENPLASNYRYAYERGYNIVSRVNGVYQKSSTSFLEHFKLSGLRDSCKILLSERQYSSLKSVRCEIFFWRWESCSGNFFQ